MKQKKQFTELSDEELKQVTGGASIDCSLPENKDNVRCSDKLRVAVVDQADFKTKTLDVG